MVAEHATTRSTVTVHRVLGICWVVYGILELGGAIWLALFGNTATLMFGALLNRVADPFTMMDAFHFFYALLVVGSAISGIVEFAAGVMFLSGARSGHFLGILAASLSLWRIPIGTTLGIYTLILLLPIAGRQGGAAVSRAQATALETHAMPM
jgi:hypothetical protein